MSNQDTERKAEDRGHKHKTGCSNLRRHQHCNSCPDNPITLQNSTLDGKQCHLSIDEVRGIRITEEETRDAYVDQGFVSEEKCYMGFYALRCTEMDSKKKISLYDKNEFIFLEDLHMLSF